MIRREDVTNDDRDGLRSVVAMIYRGERFLQAKARKAADCWRCGEAIERGARTWRVLGNGRNRMRRLHYDCGLAEVLERAGVRR